MSAPVRSTSPPAAAVTRVVAVAAAICLGGLAAGVGPALAAFPGANGKIAFTSDRAGTNDIWTMSPNGDEPVNLTPDGPADDSSPNWSADGRKIVFESDRKTRHNPVPAGLDAPDFELFTMNADGSHVRQITFNELDDDDPAWSPDGKRVVFLRDFEPVRGQVDYDVFTVKVSGADERNLTNTPATEGSPSWSPNGRRIAFYSDLDHLGGDAATEIYTMNIDGSRLRRLTDNETWDEEPSWSPNGRKLSFQSYREGQLSIYTMRADGSDQKRLTYDVPDTFGSTWSPDGRVIAFSSFSERDVFTVGLHGRETRNLTDSPTANDVVPDWQPLPRKRH